jgi:hypothetical protein
MAFITLFTAPKPFRDPHIINIQRNAFNNWKQFAPDLDVIVLGDEEGIAEAAQEAGFKHIAEVRKNSQGTPLVSSLFELARKNSDSPLLACINADILILPDFIETARQAAAQSETFLLVGQRWDLEVTEALDFTMGWLRDLKQRCQSFGKLHPRGGSDYFIYPRVCYQSMPDFAIGRAGWDNWMIYEARCQGWNTIDASLAIQVIHQNHDYSHLPNGQPHYRLPETFENVRMAGGKRTIFKLDDTNKVFKDGKIKPAPLNWAKFWREVEIMPLVRWHNLSMGEVFYKIFHPVRAYREFRSALKKS